MPTTRTLDPYHPKSDKDLPPVPAVGAITTATHQSGHSTLLRPTSHWGTSKQEQSPTHPEQQQDKPIAPASAVPERESSPRYKRASPPHIEEDYDQYRNMLAEAATASQKGDRDVFHDVSEEAQPPISKTDQQKASREYGRRQIHATDGANDLNMQGLSIADDGTGIGRTSAAPTPMNEASSNTRSAADPTANKQNVTARKPLPPRPEESTNQQAQTHAPSSILPHLDQHPPPTTVSPTTTNDPNHTFSTSPHPDPLARLPPSFNPKNTTNTTVDTTVAPAITHETLHTKRIEIVQESITRDIHVHHHYHYIQPIKVVEVQPARHFRTNSKGEKLSIAAPEGWEMPEDMSVSRAPDLAKGEGADGGLKWTRRDYVVDEENPKGRMLSAEELEQARAQGHLIKPVSARSGGNASGVSSPVRDSERGTAR